MKNIYLILLMAASLSALWSCGSIATREEYDVYSVTEKDTTIQVHNQNAPGSRDRGVIYPSSRVLTSERNTLIKDSIVIREYPDFIRLGVFEAAGLLFSGDKNNSLGTGLFGIFPDMKNVDPAFRGNPDNIFRGGLYRFGIGEWRLRWFRDAANWTYGTSLLEVIAPDARLEKTLASVFPLYIRKRYYLRDKIPYVALTPAFGIGWYPSQYVNLSGAVEVGSIGGFNLRAYLGFAGGVNMKWTYQVRQSIYTSDSQTSLFPYFGLGISFLDFTNIVPETYKEWKYHEHSSWNIGLLQLGILASSADSSIFVNDGETSAIKGALVRICNGEVALPFLNNRFYVGTSLINLLVLGDTQWGLGILPIRLGYWQPVLEDELSTEPFIEMNYYPSSFLHIGNKLNLRIGEMVNLGVLIGYATGTNDTGYGSDITKPLGKPGDISSAYFGISLGIADRIFYPKDLRYNKNKSGK